MVAFTSTSGSLARASAVKIARARIAIEQRTAGLLFGGSQRQAGQQHFRQYTMAEDGWYVARHATQLITSPVRIVRSDCDPDLPVVSACRADRLPFHFGNGVPRWSFVLSTREDL